MAGAMKKTVFIWKKKLTLVKAVAVTPATIPRAGARSASAGACLDAIVSAPVGANAFVRSGDQEFALRNAVAIRKNAVHASKRTMRTTNRLDTDITRL